MRDFPAERPPIDLFVDAVPIRELAQFLLDRTSWPYVCGRAPEGALTARQIEIHRPSAQTQLATLVDSDLVSTAVVGRNRFYGVAQLGGQRARLRAALEPARFLAIVAQALVPASLGTIWKEPMPCTIAGVAAELLYHRDFPEPEVGLCAWALEELESLGRLRLFPPGDPPCRRYLPIGLDPDVPHPHWGRRGYARVS
jgi:hypothetical protein